MADEDTGKVAKVDEAAIAAQVNDRVGKVNGLVGKVSKGTAYRLRRVRRGGAAEGTGNGADFFLSRSSFFDSRGLCANALVPRDS